MTDDEHTSESSKITNDSENELKSSENSEVSDETSTACEPHSNSENREDLESLKAREQSLKNELLYLRAEFDNFRKRMLREQEAAIRFANERFIKELIPIIDLFDKAMQSAASSTDARAWIAGIELTQKELLQTLSRHGVELIGNPLEVFNPERHEAISEMETDNLEEVGKILQVAQRGCLFQGRLIKPAQVVVGKAKITPTVNE